MKIPEALGVLSTGLDFERVAADVVKARIKVKMSEMETLFGIAPNDFLQSPGGPEPQFLRLIRMAEPEVVAQIAAQKAVNLQAQVDAAWESFRLRLGNQSPGSEQMPASLAEMFCAVRGVGPAAVLGLDLERIPLFRWTSTLLTIAGESRTSKLPRTVPRWVAGYALRQLGGKSISASSAAKLLQHAAFKRPDEISVEPSTLSAIKVTKGGVGYKKSPSVKIVGGGGKGASATAIVKEGVVTDIVVDTSGAGYTTAPVIAISGGGGAEAAGTAVLMMQTSTDELDSLLQTESLGTGTSNRWAIIIRNTKGPLTGSWSTPPELGWVMIVERQQLESELLTELVLSAFPDSAGIIAWEEPYETPEFQNNFTPRLPMGGSMRYLHTYLYPRTALSQKSPSIVDPAGPDAIFRAMR